MEHEVLKSEEQLILAIKESRIDFINVNEFRSLVFKTIAGVQNQSFLLDMREVSYVSSSCISVLLSLNEQYKNRLPYLILLNKKQKKLLGALSLMDHLNIQFDD